MNKKGIIIGISSAAVVIAAAVILIVCLNKNTDVYRIIKVMSVSGLVTAERESIGELDAYEGMVLQSGDHLHVAGNSSMVMTMDEDKVAYVEENTQFSVIAEGTSASSKTYIDVKDGTITCEIRNKLSDDSLYEVNTPNSTIAIRGTAVSIEVISDELTVLKKMDNGIKYHAEVIETIQKNKFTSVTRISVTDGKVAVQCKDGKGNPVGDPIDLGETKEVYIGGNENTSQVLIPVSDIDLSTFSKTTLEIFEKIKKESGKCVYSDDELEDALNTMEESEYTVTFTNSGSVFGTQTVKKGGTITEPTLIPTSKGHWDTEFSTPVENDVEIKWISE